MPTDHSRGDVAAFPLQNRRGALGTLGLGTLALFGSSGSAFGFFTRKPKVSVVTAAPAVNLEGLPEEWVIRQGGELKAYASYLSSLRLQRLTPRQVIEAHAKKKGTVWNALPPRSMWKQMAPTLKVVDRVAIQIGQPVKEIVSAYRTPAYNARCSGAKKGSWHQANVAVDVKFGVGSSTIARTARSLRSHGLFQGGVGRYSGFTHIDTRGQNVDW